MDEKDIIIKISQWISQKLSLHQLQAVGFVLLAIGMIYGFMIQRYTRNTILYRRRLFKDLLRREDRGEIPFSSIEEKLVMLLGRSQGIRFLGFDVVTTMIICGASFLLVLGEGNYGIFGITLVFSHFFLTGRLHFHSFLISRVLPPDTYREGSALKKSEK